MEGYLRKYGWAVQLAFVIIVAALLAVIASEVVAIYLAPYRVPDVDLTQHPQVTKKNNDSSGVHPAVMARTIEDRCLFAGCPEPEGPRECIPPCQPGELCSNGVCVADPNQMPNEEPQGDLPVESTSGTKLLGVLVASNPRYSTAILKTPSSAVTSILGIGDKIDNAEIKEIYRDRVIFSNNGRLEFVRLDDSLQGNPNTGRVIGSPRPSSSSNSHTRGNNQPRDFAKERGSEPVAVEAKAAPSANNPAPSATKRVTLSRRDLNDALREPATVARAANIVPHYANGRPSGVRVVSLRPPLDRLGLRSGDVIKRINGQQITSQLSAFSAFSSLKNAKSVDVEIDRGGRTESYNYSIQ